MEKVHADVQEIIDALDEKIEELEEKLRKAQPMIDRLAKLKRMRALALDERTVTSGAGRFRASLSMETVIHEIRTNGPGTAVELADRAGVTPTTMRSHLNRHADVRYRKDEDNNWHLIGENGASGADDEEED